jgi:tetratricopeptide (TPR) repeat protein
LSGTLIHRICARALNLVWAAAVRRIESHEVEGTLRSLLRRFPYWQRGHTLLAESALRHDNVGQAYAAALCCKALAGEDSTLIAEALLTLARCHLRRGDWQTALHHLEKALPLNPSNYEINEEAAAAHMLAGNYLEALKLLSSIPETRISAEGKAALQFARSKTL